jgi:hypothetical protein
MNAPLTPRLLALPCALLACAGAAQAATPPMKPGLWEVTVLSREMNGQPMPDMSAMMSKRMDKMPPEMRAQIEAQMKAQGVQMGAKSGAIRSCVSQEMIRDHLWQQHEGRCQNAGVNQSGNTWTVNFTCQNPEATGEVRATFKGSDSYSSEMTVTTQRKGQPMTMRMRHDARWLGADCGDLKPMNPAAMPTLPPPKR